MSYTATSVFAPWKKSGLVSGTFCFSINSTTMVFCWCKQSMCIKGARSTAQRQTTHRRTDTGCSFILTSTKMPIILSFCVKLQVSHNQPNKDNVCVCTAADSLACRQLYVRQLYQNKKPDPQLRRAVTVWWGIKTTEWVVRLKLEPLKYCLHDGEIRRWRHRPHIWV